MKTRWIKKFRKEAREVKLTAHDKRAMLSHIIGPSNIPSPYSFFLTVMEYRQKIAVAGVIFALLLTSGGTSFAATGALPGEALYPIKVNVNEGLQSLVAVTPDAKAKVQVRHTQNRLIEAETLSKKGKLDAKAQAIIETKIEEHTEALKENIATLASENATATVQAVISDLKLSIEEHEITLTDIASSTASSSDQQDEHIDALINKVNEVKGEINDIGKKVEKDDKDKKDQQDKEENKSATSTPPAATTLPAATTSAITAPEPIIPVIMVTWTSSSTVSQETLPEEN
jgi:hypothetical protein